MINFIIIDCNYKNILTEITNSISKHIDNFTISKKCISNAINVHYFREDSYMKSVGFCGKNVFISHGIADKNWRDYNSVKSFDFVFVSGEKWFDKMLLQGMPKDKILIGGYPKMDYLFNDGEKPDRNGNVVWLPTHTAIKSVSSYPSLERHIDNLSFYYNMVKSAHPCDRGCGNSSDYLIKNASVIISDSGSTMYEAWALGKPVVFPDFLVRDGIRAYFRGSFEDYVYTNGIGYHCGSIESLKNSIYFALEDGITKREEEFIESIFPKELRGKSGEETAKKLLLLE